MLLYFCAKMIVPKLYKKIKSGNRYGTAVGLLTHPLLSQYQVLGDKNYYILLGEASLGGEAFNMSVNPSSVLQEKMIIML